MGVLIALLIGGALWLLWFIFIKWWFISWPIVGIIAFLWYQDRRAEEERWAEQDARNAANNRAIAQQKEALRLAEAVRAEAARKAAAEAARVAEEKRKRDEHTQAQNALETQLATLRSTSLAKKQNAMAAIVAADTSLAQAEEHFRERLLDPFWDSIEDSALNIRTVLCEIEMIEANASSFEKTAARLERPSSPFPLTPSDLTPLQVIDSSIARMKALIRESQRESNAAFTQTFHQRQTNEHLRRTNEILLGGFRNLDAAMGDVAQRLDVGMKRLRNQLQEAEQQARRAEDEARRSTEEARRAAEEARARAEDHARQTQQNFDEMRESLKRDKGPS